ncbi:MAG: hypothetical protein F9K29_07710 [Hyphomicrobiaceae bacterium]|nr:MAG: hypothetical protein F9K29_07710 [Hyphomicrobiaceae bacterium]
MKALVVILALLVAAKVGHQEYLYRTSTRDALIGAYKDRAVQACQKSISALSLGVSPQAWANPASIRLSIGKSDVDVRVWQVDNAMWSARYRNPYLFLTAGSRAGGVQCEYDIVNAAATVYR